MSLKNRVREKLQNIGFDFNKQIYFVETIGTLTEDFVGQLFIVQTSTPTHMPIHPDFAISLRFKSIPVMIGAIVIPYYRVHTNLYLNQYTIITVEPFDSIGDYDHRLRFIDNMVAENEVEQKVKEELAALERQKSLLESLYLQEQAKQNVIKFRPQ